MRGFRLTDRDMACFKEFFNYHSMTATQLVNLKIFPNDKKARERLAMLHNERFLDYCEKPYFGRGRPERVYFIKKIKEVCQLLGCSQEDFRVIKPAAYSPFLLHQLAITDFMICVRQACKLSNYDAIIIPEYKQIAGKVTKIRKSIAQDVVIDGNNIELIPDGLVCLSRRQQTVKSLFFFEIFRGTQTIESEKQCIRNKLEAYASFWEQGLYKDFANMFSYDFNGFRVLLIISQLSYLEKLKEICSLITPVGLFWLALSENISPNTFFEPIWYVSGKKDLKALVRKVGDDEKAS